MKYEAHDFSRLIGMDGFSEPLLRNHFELYGGYVKNTNKMAEKLTALAGSGQMSEPEFGELNRRFGWEFDGMRLHELYFGNLGGHGSLDPGGALARSLVSSFGSVEAWEKRFRATGEDRGIGWVILYQDPRTGGLFNVWVNEHDTGHLATCEPLLVMDVWEHAFMLDYGTKRAGYIEAFFRNIDWKSVEKRGRLAEATSEKPELEPASRS